MQPIRVIVADDHTILREGVVADQFGRVLGYDNLLICDASLFPRSPVRNPFVPIVQLAERLTSRWRRYGI